VVLIKVTKSLVCRAFFFDILFASQASYYDMITIVALFFFFFSSGAALILKVMSLSLKMDLKQFFMWNH
jgi:phosphate starvation-inducible membrane PsiE